MRSDRSGSAWSTFPTIQDDTKAALLGLLPDAVLVLDCDGRVQWGNGAAEDLFGQTLSEAFGVSAFDFIHHDDVELAMRSLVSIQKKDVGELIELRVATPAGWRLAEVIGRPLPEPQVGVVFCIRDVTDRRRFEVAHDDVAKFRSIVQNAAFVTVLVSADGTIQSVSAALTRLFGHDPETVEGRNFVELFSPNARPRLQRALETASNKGRAFGPLTVEADCQPFAGTKVVPVELAIVSLLDDPTVEGFVISMRDISERSLAEGELRETLSLLNATLDSTADGILVVSSDNRVVRYNQRFVDLWNIPDDIIASGDDARLISFMSEQLMDPSGFLAQVSEFNSAAVAERFDALILKDGRVFERYSLPQRLGDEIIGRVLSLRDVTERKRLEESLAYQAFHDPLTGLANKGLFLEELQRAAARSRRGLTSAVLFIDVDGLKLMNDRFGHMLGDQLLVRVAEVLRSTVRSCDTVARIGGDEFGVLAEDVSNPSDVAILAQRMLAGVSGPLEIGTSSAEVSLSIGVSFVSPNISYLDTLRDADSAMYSAKQKGGGRMEIFGGI
jgi:diguanylate cyclase (GGDEF)-like protein/PAS domain S-box-containing protein